MQNTAFYWKREEIPDQTKPPGKKELQRIKSTCLAQFYKKNEKFAAFCKKGEKQTVEKI